MTGDFNGRLGREDDRYAEQLRSVFVAFGLRVSASGPTHRLGGVLDLVAHRSDVSLSTDDVDCYDHRLLY
jgi:hypothetical protein